MAMSESNLKRYKYVIEQYESDNIPVKGCIDSGGK